MMMPNMIETDLVVLEERIERVLFRDFREAGEYLKVIRDEKLFLCNHASFGEYVEQQFRIHRGTAYSYIQAAEVMRDVSSCDDSLNLPQRHAALLYRFDAETRCEVARVIAPMSFREAARLVIEMTEQKAEGSEKAPEHEPDDALRTLADILREIGGLDEGALRASLADLKPGARSALARELGVSIRRLRKVADAT